MKSDYPHIWVVNGDIKFVDGDLINIPLEYIKNHNRLAEFYKKVLEQPSDEMVVGIDPLNFNYIYLNNHCNVGLLLSNSGAQRSNVKKYPGNHFPRTYLLGRIKKERRLLSYEDFIPREFVTQNIHELRNLNAKISSNIDALLNINQEDEWEEKFDKADENVKKIFVASRLIKFILDNIKFYIPDYIKTISVDKSRTFRVHRSLSKIVKIYRNDFKKKKTEIRLAGTSNKILQGDRELFEIILMLLIENAIKYSQDYADLSPLAEIEDVNRITEIRIKSYGLIIPGDEQPKLFSKGFRSTVHRQSNEGTGMGLHNAHEIVKLFNGSLSYSCQILNTVNSYQIGWNCFRITLS